MLAFVYLAVAIYFGDRICRRLFQFISIQHRIATAFLVGLLVSSWITYLSALAGARLRQPLVAGDLSFLVLFVLACYKLPKQKPVRFEGAVGARPDGRDARDWLFLGAFLLFSCWLMFATLNFKEGQFEISFKSWTDFGANVSLVQSFALGHNFPTEHPFFPGELIRYHFLFWFQAANLEFLGLNPVWSINLLSILSLVALLILIATFAEVLFASRTVGRIAASLFFFSSSLSYVPFLRSQPGGIKGIISSVVHSTEFLASGYPFRGETWGALSANVFAYQRHLISGLGLLFVVMIALVQRYRSFLIESEPEATSEVIINTSSPEQSENKSSESDNAQSQSARAHSTVMRQDLPAFLFFGALIGLLPYWNSPVFLSGLAILGCVFLFLPLRLYMAASMVAAVAVGLPQVLLLRSGNVVTASMFHWGYTLEHPTLGLVLKYLAWTFGLKWLLIAIALVFLSGFHRRLFLALSSLVVIVFFFQLSTDIFNNHKLLNVWVTFANVYAAYALWRIAKFRIAGVAMAIILTIATIFGGVIDLFPLHNDPALTVPYKNDRLRQWLLENTNPSDIFLTHTLLTHPILFSGRKIYLGYTLFAWTAGYDVPAREAIYRRMFEEQDSTELIRLLNENKIAYVAIDDGVRGNEALYELNESVYQEHFEKVFADTGLAYDNVTIYKVPHP